MDAPSIQALLRQLRDHSGALAVAWTGASGRTEFPRRGGAPWDAGLGRGNGRVLRLGRRASARVPRLAALGARFAAVRRADGPDGPQRLALAAKSGLSLTDEAIEALFTALLALEEERLQAARARQRTVLANLGRAAASAAHDLRNVLSTALLELDALDGRQGDAEAGLRRAVSTARDLARDFLQLEDARERRAVDLGGLLRREVGRQRQGSVCLREFPGVLGGVLGGAPGEVRELWVAGRHDLLARVVANLLTNALEASPRGRPVELEVGRVGSAVELAIVDHGRGMDQVRLDRYLEPGVARGGSGFGTASVLHCLARVGGELVIESGPSAGTRCVVRLASAPAPGAPAALVHDPDPLARRSWRAVFEQAGWTAVDTADLDEALAWLAGCELLAALAPRSRAARLARAARERGVPIARTGVVGASAETDLPRVAGGGSREALERFLSRAPSG